ncbi:glycoside hydrolase [Opitutaceae bacterium EW11]|nr:glycoside hydrolase [Opitutaceae bacterium EW11]
MPAARTSLAGKWICVLDPKDAGLRESWARTRLDGTLVHLPGTLAAQGLGDPPSVETHWTGTIFDRSFFDSSRYAPYRELGNFKVPFWLQPERVYVGSAWFQRDVEVPEDWAGSTLHLFLQRPHGQTRVWWDDAEVGSSDSLSVPHRFVLSRSAEPGVHRLTVRVDNRLNVDVGENAHSVSDHTQGNWNGVAGRIELLRTENTWVEDFQLYPNFGDGQLRVKARIAGEVPPRCRVTLAINAVRDEVPPARWSLEREVAVDGALEFSVEFGRAAPRWDEFSPAVFHARLALENGESKTVTFGFRELHTEGRAILVNGRRVFLRGALDCCAYPRTGHPPVDVESWREILRTFKLHGLNHVRFHSWCPPRAAFEAADELGVYLQVECSIWPNSVAVLAFNSPAGIGDGSPVDAWLRRETEAILREHGNHPSFVLLAAGNEPGGPHHKEFLAGWVRETRAKDPRRLYTAASGWPELPENDVHVHSDPRIHQWGDGLKCRLNGSPPATLADHQAVVEKRDRPLISHEIGQWCSYPPVYDTGEYTGYLRARNYELFRDSLEKSGLADQARDFVWASGKLQALCYREEIETSLRTRDLAGFQLLGLADFPGQGTAPVGVLDVFWKSKGYLEPAERARYCGPTVLLLRTSSRVFTRSEHLIASVEIAHYGAADLRDGKVLWELRSASGELVRSGSLSVARIPVGELSSIGRLEIGWRELAAPAKYRVVLSLQGTEVENEWDMWVYPDAPDTGPFEDVTATDRLEAALPALASGKPVLLELPPERIAGGVALGFSPIFWNTWCTQRQAPHTLGLLCHPEHPALAVFPTERHTNWQWWHVLHRAGALVLDGLPREVSPIVQVIDDWYSNRRLGLIAEMRVGEGRLLVCGAPLSALDNPVARQLRVSLLRYLASEAFRPGVAVTEAQLRSLIV